MATTIKLPELGENVDSGDLVRILVSAGDTISKDQPVVELETEKATIEVPSPVSGVIKELHVQQGRKVKVGDPLFTVEENGAAAKAQETPPQAEERVPQPLRQQRQTAAAAPQEAPAATPPATGAAAARPKTGETENRSEPQPQIQKKAAAQKPEPAGEEKPQKQEQKRTLRAESRPAVKREPLTGEAASAEETEAPAGLEKQETVIPFRAESPEQAARPLAPASPAIRRLARELGIDVNKVSGTGPEGYITEQDIKNSARDIISRSTAIRPSSVTSAELAGFRKVGEIERKPMTNVRRATAEHLAQTWQNVPQVTQFDKADVTELENLRARFSDNPDSGGPKITVTAIVLKIVAAALGKFPQFAASIDMPNREIIYKHYVNIGVAVDTSYGLLVPVLRDADSKNIPQLAGELAELSEKAREKKLSPADMSGGVFTITNLGGIGGTAFSPIVNYPEVAILGISRLSVEPRHIDGVFQPRKILPISLSYDHRLIDGADAARFLRWVAEALEQPALLLFRA